MEKTYKRVPFDIELAEKIQSGEVEGRIVTKKGASVRIICFDAKRVYAERDIVALVKGDDFTESIGRYRANGELMGKTCEDDDLVIELPEETPKHEFKPFDRVLVRDVDEERWRCALFSHEDDSGFIASSVPWNQCLPYEGNQDLVGTINKPKED